MDAVRAFLKSIRKRPARSQRPPEPPAVEAAASPAGGGRRARARGDADADDAVPEAQSRMKQLLRNQAAPLLGGMSLSGDDIRLVSELGDRGVNTCTHLSTHTR